MTPSIRTYSSPFDIAEIHEQNRRSWNAATVAHNSHKAGQIEFFRKGGITLYREDVELLGDLSGKRVVHLFCNAGQDTLSLVHLGAYATGVDISDEAVTFARNLSTASAIPADFVQSAALDWLEKADSNSYDIVYCSYGAIHWISDITFFAHHVSRILMNGGRFVVLDWHPAAKMFNADWHHANSYFNDNRVVTWKSGVPDYVALTKGQLTPFKYENGIMNFLNPHECYSFRWGLGEVITAFGQSSMHIAALYEYPFSRDEHFHRLEVHPDDRKTLIPHGIPNVPLLFGLIATKDS